MLADYKSTYTRRNIPFQGKVLQVNLICLFILQNTHYTKLFQNRTRLSCVGYLNLGYQHKSLARAGRGYGVRPTLVNRIRPSCVGGMPTDSLSTSPRKANLLISLLSAHIDPSPHLPTLFLTYTNTDRNMNQNAHIIEEFKIK